MSSVQLPFGQKFTPDEPWTLERPSNHWYGYQADYALEKLGFGPGNLLVIGSPLFEALEFEARGWDVTYMDVRKPPIQINYFAGDISTTSTEKTFDAVSSTCVLCHAGMGRYGDEVLDDGDLKSLKNIYASLRKGGRAALTFGPVSGNRDQYDLGNMQRVFTVDSAKRITLKAGFFIEDLKIRDLTEDLWVEDFKELGKLDRHYLSMTLRK